MLLSTARCITEKQPPRAGQRSLTKRIDKIHQATTRDAPHRSICDLVFLREDIPGNAPRKSGPLKTNDGLWDLLQ